MLPLRGASECRDCLGGAAERSFECAVRLSWLDEVLGGATGGMLRLRSGLWDWYSGAETGAGLATAVRGVMSWLADWGWLVGAAALDVFAPSLPPRDRDARFEDEGLGDAVCWFA